MEFSLVSDPFSLDICTNMFSVAIITSLKMAILHKEKKHALFWRLTIQDPRAPSVLLLVRALLAGSQHGEEMEREIVEYRKVQACGIKYINN